MSFYAFLLQSHSPVNAQREKKSLLSQDMMTIVFFLPFESIGSLACLNTVLEDLSFVLKRKSERSKYSQLLSLTCKMYDPRSTDHKH